MGSYVELLKACKEGNNKKVKKLLENCTDVGDVRDLTDKTLLHYCFKYESCAELILSVAPELLDTGEKNGYTVLHLASMIKPPTSLRYLLSKNPDINKRNNDSRSSLLLAVIYDNPEAVKLLCENNAEVNITDVNGVSPMHYAAKVKACLECENELEIINILLKHGADIDGLDLYKRSPLMWAVCSNNLTKMKHLIEKGACIYSKDSSGLSILHYATSNGNLEIIQMLLEDYKFDLETTDSNNCTALMYACSYNNVDVVELLLERGSNVNAEDSKRRNATHFASGKGDLKNLQVLHQYNVNLWKLNNDSNYPLHEASYKGHNEIVEFLITNMEPKEKLLNFINHRNSNGQTALHLSTVKDNLEICKILLQNGADPNIPLRVSNGKSMTALDLANKNETKLLIVKFNGKSSDDLLKTSTINEEITGSISDESSSEEISENSSFDSAGEIDENQKKIDSDAEEINSTYEQILNTQDEIDLRNEEVDYAHIQIHNTEEQVDHTHIQIHNTEEQVDDTHIQINDTEVQVDHTHIQINDKLEQIDSAEINNSIETNNLKDTNEFDEVYWNETNQNFNNQLKTSELSPDFNNEPVKLTNSKKIKDSSEECQILPKFTENENEINSKRQIIEITKSYKDYLFASCRIGNFEIVCSFIHDGGEVSEIRDQSGKTLLHYSLKNKELFELILKKTPELVNKFDETNLTILHMVIMSKEIERLPLLLKNNANVNFPDGNGRTALHLAVIYNNLAALECMNDYITDKTRFIQIPDNSGNYPLHYAIEICKYKKSVCQCKTYMELLLEMNGDIECRDRVSRTPLLLAINVNHVEAVETLLKNGANFLTRDIQNLCSVHYVCSEGNLEIFNQLAVFENFDPNVTDPNGLTPIFYAVSNCNEKIVKRLIELNAKLDIVDQYGRTLCHKAAEKGAFKCLELLLSYGVDPWSKCHDGTMPLHEAAYRGYKEIAEILLNTPSAIENVNEKNNSGQTALHLAAVRNDCPMCFLLISKDSKINELLHNTSDNEELTAYDLATTPDCKNTLKTFGGRSAKKVINCSNSELDYSTQYNAEIELVPQVNGYDISAPVSIRSTELALSTVPSAVYTYRTNEICSSKNIQSIQVLQNSKTTSKKSDNSSKKKISLSSSDKSSTNISFGEAKEGSCASVKINNPQVFESLPSSQLHRVDTGQDSKTYHETTSRCKSTHLIPSTNSIEFQKMSTCQTESILSSNRKKSTTQSKSANSSNKKQKKSPPSDKNLQKKVQKSVINYEYIRLNCKVANDIARLKFREENIEKLINPKMTKLHKTGCKKTQNHKIAAV